MASREIESLASEYLAVATCTDPADRQASESAILRQYEAAGYKAPEFLWCDGPATASLAVWLLWERAAPTLRRALRLSLGEQILRWKFPREDWLWKPEPWRSPDNPPSDHERRWRAVSYDYHGSLVDPLRASLGDLFRKPFGDWLEGPLGDSLRRSLPRRLRSLLWPPFSAARWGPVPDSWGLRERVLRKSCFYGQHERKRQPDPWDSRSCGWWWPFRRICVIAERPSVLRAEPGGRAGGDIRLHCPDGPAMVYRDGWAVHAWHGTGVPASLIEDGWDFPAIVAEWNAEVRRCAIEKLGWDNFEQHLVQVASVPDPGNPGQVIGLYDVPEPMRSSYRQPPRLLLCSNGTPEPDGTRRRFGLPVPAHHTDPVAAAAELYGWTREEYARLARRA